MQRVFLSVVVVMVLSLGARALGQSQTLRAPGDTASISDEQRAAGFTFDASVAPGDRAWILAAVAKARPEAARLIEEVDGVVTLRTRSGLDLGVGVTHSRIEGGVATFIIDLDIATLNGRRVVDRDVVMMHELGHAVDLAIVPQKTNDVLEAGIPRTGSCGQDVAGSFGSCTEPAERFADTFAKWALRGSVSAVGAGYGVATPASLEDWGAPLGRLSSELER